MASIYDKASLVLIPSGTKTSKVYSQVPTNGDGDFTFSRSTAATRVNASGNIEKETSNLLLQSNTFDTTWTLSNAAVTGAHSGYDGSNDAWELDVTTAAGHLQQSFTAVSGVHTISIYAKQGTLDFLMIYARDAGGSNDAEFYFDLANGVTGSTKGANPITLKITDVGGGWYRCEGVSKGGFDQYRIYGSNVDNSVTGTGNIYIQDAQLEQGLVARDYIETTTTAIYGGITDNVPRLDYQGSCPALLLEPQRTNIVPISEGVPEDSTAVTLTKNYGTSPEGVQNSLKVQKLGVTSNDRIYPIDNYNAVLVSGRDYTISAFVKNIDVTGVTTIACRISGGTLFRQGYQWTGASLATSTYNQNGTRTNVLAEDYGNGWWRIGFTFEADGTSGNFELDIDRDNGTDTTSIETWGWQLESATGDASYATSYIPTYGSAVTRNVENCQATDAALIGQTEGTLFWEGQSIGDNDAPYISLYNNSNNRVLIYYSSGNVSAQVRVGGVVEFQSASQSVSGKIKMALGYKNGSYAFYVNGLQVTASSNSFSGFVSPQLNKVDLGYFSQDGGSNNQLLVFKTRLSNEELATLTTI